MTDFTVFQVVMIFLTGISTMLWVIIQYNVIRFVKRQDGFSTVKDDHETRITKVEATLTSHDIADVKRDAEHNRSYDRLEGSLNEVRSDVKGLRETIYEYLLKVNEQQHHAKK